MSRSCSSRLSRRSRTRSKSAASRRGPRNHLGQQRQRRRRDRSSVVRPTSVASAPTSVSSCAPSRPSASCSASASRSPQPSSRRSPVIAASPGRSAGSNAAPARTSDQHRKERHFAVYGRPGVEAVRQPPAPDLRKREGGLRARTAAGAIDRQASGHGHRQRALERQRRAAARHDAQRDAAGAEPSRRGAHQTRRRRRGDTAPDLRRNIQGSRGRRCRRSADRTCRRNRRRSAAGAGNALRPAPGTAPARRRTDRRR